MGRPSILGSPSISCPGRQPLRSVVDELTAAPLDADAARAWLTILVLLLPFCAEAAGTTRTTGGAAARNSDATPGLKLPRHPRPACLT